MFELAQRLEAQGEYEAACFHYAVARNAGANRSACETRIRALWHEYGPFQFRDIGEELRSCGQGYHQLTMGDIDRIVRKSQVDRS